MQPPKLSITRSILSTPPPSQTHAGCSHTYFFYFFGVFLIHMLHCPLPRALNWNTFLIFILPHFSVCSPSSIHKGVAVNREQGELSTPYNSKSPLNPSFLLLCGLMSHHCQSGLLSVHVVVAINPAWLNQTKWRSHKWNKMSLSCCALLLLFNICISYLLNTTSRLHNFYWQMQIIASIISSESLLQEVVFCVYSSFWELFSFETSRIAVDFLITQQHFQFSGLVGMCFSSPIGLVVAFRTCDLIHENRSKWTVFDMKASFLSLNRVHKNQDVWERAPGSSNYEHLWDIMFLYLFKFQTLLGHVKVPARLRLLKFFPQFITQT